MRPEPGFDPDLSAFWCLPSQEQKISLGTLRGRMSLTPLSPIPTTIKAFLGPWPRRSLPSWLNEPLWSSSFLESKAFLIK